MDQIKNSMDKETVWKIVKGFLFGLASAISSGSATYLATRDIKTAIAVGLSALVAPVINTPIEYVKGQDKEKALNE